jgi:hypothetical protein
LTDYSIPSATEHRGFRDVEADFQEAVISVLDRSEWIANLDVLKSLTKNIVFRKASGSRMHSSETCKRHNDLRSAGIDLTSVDTWHELN